MSFPSLWARNRSTFVLTVRHPGPPLTTVGGFEWHTRIFVQRGNGRSPWTRRWRDLIEEHAADLGGAETLSVAQRSLIRRAATLEVELEAVEGRLSEGKSADLAAFAAVTGHLRRVLETLGIARRPRDVTPPLSYFLRGDDG